MQLSLPPWSNEIITNGERKSEIVVEGIQNIHQLSQQLEDKNAVIRAVGTNKFKIVCYDKGLQDKPDVTGDQEWVPDPGIQERGF